MTGTLIVVTPERAAKGRALLEWTKHHYVSCPRQLCLMSSHPGPPSRSKEKLRQILVPRTPKQQQQQKKRKARTAVCVKWGCQLGLIYWSDFILISERKRVAGKTSRQGRILMPISHVVVDGRASRAMASITVLPMNKWNHFGPIHQWTTFVLSFDNPKTSKAMTAFIFQVDVRAKSK